MLDPWQDARSVFGEWLWRSSALGGCLLYGMTRRVLSPHSARRILCGTIAWQSLRGVLRDLMEARWPRATRLAHRSCRLLRMRFDPFDRQRLPAGSMHKLDSHDPQYGPKSKGFGEVRGLDRSAVGQIGDGAGDLEDSHRTPR